MIAVLITAIPGIIAGLFNRWLFLAALFAIIPIIYLVNRFSVIIKWNLVEGIIEDVTLVNDFNQPYTEAHIIFKTKDNMEHECRFTIGHYGDYEEGIEPELENIGYMFMGVRTRLLSYVKLLMKWSSRGREYGMSGIEYYSCGDWKFKFTRIEI